jgi:hypothetical protein
MRRPRSYDTAWIITRRDHDVARPAGVAVPALAPRRTIAKPRAIPHDSP